MIAASNRAAAGVYEDTTGPLIVAALEEAGFEVTGPVVVPDGEPVGAAIREAVDSGARAVITTGGTGLTPTDLTPEVTRPLLDREVPGVAEAIRAYGVANGVPTAALSRGLAAASRTASPSSYPCSATRWSRSSGATTDQPVARRAAGRPGGPSPAVDA